MPRKWPITFLNSALKRYAELCQVFIFNVPRLGHIIKFTEKKQAYDNEISAVNWGCWTHKEATTWQKDKWQHTHAHCKCCFCFSSHTCWTMKEGRRREEEKKLTDLLILHLILIVKSNAHLDIPNMSVNYTHGAHVCQSSQHLFALRSYNYENIYICIFIYCLIHRAHCEYFWL